MFSEVTLIASLLCYGVFCCKPSTDLSIKNETAIEKLAHPNANEMEGAFVLTDSCGSKTNYSAYGFLMGIYIKENENEYKQLSTERTGQS